VGDGSTSLKGSTKRKGRGGGKTFGGERDDVISKLIKGMLLGGKKRKKGKTESLVENRPASPEKERQNSTLRWIKECPTSSRRKIAFNGT